MALREINLVPDSILRHRRLRRHGGAWALVYGLLLAALAGGFVAFQQRKVAKGEGEGREQELGQQMAATVAEIEDRKEKIGQLSLVRQLSHPIGTAEILGRLAEVVDSGSWMTAITIASDDEATSPRLSLEGLTVSNAKLGATLQRIAGHALFDDVVLDFSSEAPRPRGIGDISDTFVQFKVTANVVLE